MNAYDYVVEKMKGKNAFNFVLENWHYQKIKEKIKIDEKITYCSFGNYYPLVWAIQFESGEMIIY